MPLYEYYCARCDRVFEALRSLRDSDEPVPCPDCGSDAGRIMPTTFASMSLRQGYAQRVPYHHRPIRSDEPTRTIALVKPGTGKKPETAANRSQKAGGEKK